MTSPGVVEGKRDDIVSLMTSELQEIAARKYTVREVVKVSVEGPSVEEPVPGEVLDETEVASEDRRDEGEKGG